MERGRHASVVPPFPTYSKQVAASELPPHSVHLCTRIRPPAAISRVHANRRTERTLLGSSSVQSEVTVAQQIPQDLGS